MQKNVQIESELFIMLINYFNNSENNNYMSEEIKKKLNDKLDKLLNHELFTKYKRATTADEREQARKEYLKQRGINKDFISDLEITYDKL